MIHHPSILQNLNKFRVIKKLGFKTKELRGSARSCTELRGVDVEEGRTFSFCYVPSSRVAKVNHGPSLMGSTSGNESEIQSLVEKVQRRATEPRRLAQRAHSLVGPGRRLRGPGEGETSYEASLV